MKNQHSFLLVKTSSIGDIIQTMPVLEYLHKKFPCCEIDWVVEKGNYTLVRSHPLVRNVLIVDTKKWRKHIFSKTTWKEMFAFCKHLKDHSYEVLFDLQGNTKSAWLTFFAKAKQKVGFGFSSVKEKPNLLVTNTKINVDLNQNVRLRYLTLVKNFFEDKEPFTPKGIELLIQKEEKDRLDLILSLHEGKNRPLIMVCFASKWANKCLHEDTLRLFLKRIYQEFHPYFFFIYGDDIEKNVADTLSKNFKDSETIGEMSIPFWQSLMSHMDACIAMDSAALHLCGTTKTPSFSVFGPSSASIFKPLGDNHFALQGKCPYGISFVERCRKLRSCPTGACMKDISATELFDQFNLFWQSKEK